MDAGLFERGKHRWLLLAISAFSYGLGALTISWVMSKMFHQSALDRAAVRYYAILFASMVWIFGAGYASFAVSIEKQLCWWPVSILLAGFHGGTITFTLVALLGGGLKSLEPTAEFCLIAIIAAALSYLYFLLIAWIIARRTTGRGTSFRG